MKYTDHDTDNEMGSDLQIMNRVLIYGSWIRIWCFFPMCGVFCCDGRDGEFFCCEMRNGKVPYGSLMMMCLFHVQVLLSINTAWLLSHFPSTTTCIVLWYSIWQPTGGFCWWLYTLLLRRGIWSDFGRRLWPFRSIFLCTGRFFGWRRYLTGDNCLFDVLSFLSVVMISVRFSTVHEEQYLPLSLLWISILEMTEDMLIIYSLSVLIFSSFFLVWAAVLFL